MLFAKRCATYAKNYIKHKSIMHLGSLARALSESKAEHRFANVVVRILPYEFKQQGDTRKRALRNKKIALQVYYREIDESISLQQNFEQLLAFAEKIGEDA